MTTMTMIDSAEFLQVQGLKEVAQEASTLLSRLANPDRLMILCLLVGGEKNVTEIGKEGGIQQPTLSQQLTVLRKDGLVATRRDGKYVYYRIGSPDVLRIMRTMHDIFCKDAKAQTAK
ncbi:MAG TPA: metalloregulator ArsR/SmtB family transcription factor [Paenalcaligenes sp.]|nr:metalloregulator ArsR/SmtB family transcription factor [Paenalcaligenes sp.]